MKNTEKFFMCLNGLNLVNGLNYNNCGSKIVNLVMILNSVTYS